MADLLSVTAPLTIRYPDGTRHLMVASFPHPEGVLYFEPFWREQGVGNAAHLVRGPIKGEGPWKVGDAVVTVAGCHGTDPEIALQLAAWQEHLACCDGPYAEPEEILELARALGARVTQ